MSEIISILFVVVLGIIMIYVFFLINNKSAIDKKHIDKLDSIIIDYKNIKRGIMNYKKEMGVLPGNIKELSDEYRNNLIGNNYALSMDRKHLIVYNVESERANCILDELKNNSYYEGGFLYLSFVNQKKSEVEPKAVITMIPDSNLKTTTHIDWNYKDSVTENSEIKDVEWENKHFFYDEQGDHTIRLRVKDQNNYWSEWTEKTFTVTEEIGVKTIVAGNGCFFILHKNGNCDMLFLNKDIQKYEKKELFKENHINSIAAGSGHIILSTYNQRMYSLGSNNLGQLGLGSTENENSFMRIDDIYDARKVFAGENTSSVLCYSGKLYSWGNNKFGQLGDATIVNKIIPTEIKSIIGVKRISISKGHTISLLVNGNVMIWGNNSYGELGNGTRANKKVPIHVDLKNCRDIAAGDNFSLAVAENGHVYSWGRNDFYQLGKNNISDESFPSEIRGLSEIVQIRANEFYSVALDKFGKVYVWGAIEKGVVISKIPIVVETIEHVQFIAVNNTHVFTITYEGIVKYWVKGDENNILSLNI